MARTRSKTIRRRRRGGAEGEDAPTKGVLGRIGDVLGNLNPFKKAEPAAEPAAAAPAPAESGDGVPAKMGGRTSRKSRRTRRRHSRR